MNEKDERPDLKKRSKEFALRIIRLYVSLPRRAEAQVMGRQLLRSGTSVGAHHREASRARSDADFKNWQKQVTGWSFWENQGRFSPRYLPTSCAR